METRKKILKHTKNLVAKIGVAALGIRLIADESGVAASVIYHHFQNKDELLYQMFVETSKHLGMLRHKLPEAETAVAMLRQRIQFQIDHAEDVVAVLKYYLAYRSQFERNPQGFIPEKAYLHIVEVLERGVASGEFIDLDIPREAKVITHAINGFLLEYYPSSITGDEREQLVQTIHQFILRSIKA